MSSEDTAPKSFFSLSRELRDKIYDIVHTLRESVEFGIDQQLTVSFPLPRLHHISRRFRDECDRRTPSDTTIKIYQADELFQARGEQLELPKIVHLRAMQTHQVIGKLIIELAICDIDASSDEIFGEMNRCIRWMEGFVANACTNLDDVSATLIVDRAIHIAYAEEDLEDMRSCAFAAQARLVFQALSSQIDGIDDVDGDFINLAVWNKTRRSWDFNYREIAKCEKTVGIARYQEDDE